MRSSQRIPLYRLNHSRLSIQLHTKNSKGSTPGGVKQAIVFSLRVEKPTGTILIESPVCFTPLVSIFSFQRIRV